MVQFWYTFTVLVLPEPLFETVIEGIGVHVGFGVLVGVTVNEGVGVDVEVGTGVLVGVGEGICTE